MRITLGTVTSLVTRPVFAEDIIGNGEHNHVCTVLVHLVLTHFTLEAKKIRDAFSRHFLDQTKKEKWSKIVSFLGSNFNQNDSR